MKWLFTILFLLLAGVLLGILAVHDPGYVLISREYTTIEMTLALFVTIQIIVFAILYTLIRIAVQTLRMPRDLRSWRLRRRRDKAHGTSSRGLIELAEGHWQKAELALLKNIRHTETPLLNYLSAARAAQKQNAHERRDHYLSMAAQSTPNADIAVELTQAELQLAHGQLEQALATLEHLRTIAPHHAHVLLLLIQLYERLQNWDDLKNLLPLLKKHKVMDEKSLQNLSLRTYHALLAQAAKNNDRAKLEQFWRTIPKALRNDSMLISHYARLLLEMQKHDDAEQLLRTALKREWHPHWVDLYGKVKSSQVDKQLQTAETWLKGRENNAQLLLCLGRLCLQNKLWGKARSYLEASVNNQPRIETYQELGQLLQQLDEPVAASECFEKGLRLATESQQ